MALAEYYNGTSWAIFGSGVTSIGITSNSSGLSVSGSPITISGVINLTLGSELQALSAFASTGLMARTGSNTYAGRTLTQGTGINIANGDGIFGNPTISVSTIDINANTTGNLAISRLAGYPSNSSVFLNGSGSWVAPSFSNLITTNLIDYAITINNTNSSAFATGFALQNNGVLVTSFGFNNSTNESYIWNYGTANLKFGINNTKRMQLLNDGTLDLMTNDLITTGTINAQTGTLKGNNLASYNLSSIFVANSLAMNSNSITALANGVLANDAVNKGQLDAKTVWFTQPAGNYTVFNTAIGITTSVTRNGNFGYFNSSGNTGTSSGTNNYSLDCSDRIKASEFNAFSSIRKKNILSDDENKVQLEAIELLKHIPTVKYEYKDKIKEGFSINYGVIAESLNQILPNYVDMESYDFVPNIMNKHSVKYLNDNIWTIEIRVKNYNIDLSSKKIKLLTEEKDIYADIIEIKDSYIKISTNEILEKKEFVYGTYETCPTVSKPKLFELSMVVVQNLLKRVEQLELQLNNR